MYSGNQAEVKAKNRGAEEVPDGPHPFSTYCQVYWEESTAVAVRDKCLSGNFAILDSQRRGFAVLECRCMESYSLGG